MPLDVKPGAQIQIIQNGSEIFAFDTVQVTDDPYPRVYIGWAMNTGSYDANRIGLKWINRAQFEWLVKHFECPVSYLGLAETKQRIFFCHKHQTVEEAGEDVDVIESMIHYKDTEPEVLLSVNWWEEDREI